MSEDALTQGFDDVNAIKKVFETILGATVDIEFTLNNIVSKQLFIDIIKNIITVSSQNELVFSATGMDLDTITSPYLSIIEKLFVLHFGEEAFEIITWYVSKQITPNRIKTKLEDDDGNLHKIDTPEDLWEFLEIKFFSE